MVRVRPSRFWWIRSTDSSGLDSVLCLPRNKYETPRNWIGSPTHHCDSTLSPPSRIDGNRIHTESERAMCTRVIWPDANGAVLVGRNMDFHKDLMTNLWKHPRGVARDDGVKGELTWTSKYGSVIAAAFDIGPGSDQQALCLRVDDPAQHRLGRSRRSRLRRGYAATETRPAEQTVAAGRNCWQCRAGLRGRRPDDLPVLRAAKTARTRAAGTSDADRHPLTITTEAQEGCRCARSCERHPLRAQ